MSRKYRTTQLHNEAREWLDRRTITSGNIGEYRRKLMVPWASDWNAFVREETAERENKLPVA